MKPNFWAAFIQKSTGNSKATETVVPQSEQMELKVFGHSKETKKKRQRNWQETRNLQFLHSRHAVNQLSVSRYFFTRLSIPLTPILFTFIHSQVRI